MHHLGPRLALTDLDAVHEPLHEEEAEAAVAVRRAACQRTGVPHDDLDVPAGTPGVDLEVGTASAPRRARSHSTPLRRRRPMISYASASLALGRLEESAPSGSAKPGRASVGSAAEPELQAAPADRGNAAERASRRRHRARRHRGALSRRSIERAPRPSGAASLAATTRRGETVIERGIAPLNEPIRVEDDGRARLERRLGVRVRRRRAARPAAASPGRRRGTPRPPPGLMWSGGTCPARANGTEPTAGSKTR